MKNTFLLFLVLLLAKAAFGQDSFSAALNLSYTRLNAGDTAAHSRQFEFKFNAAIYKNTKNLLSANVTYTNEAFNGFPSSFGSAVQGLNVGLNWLGATGSKSALAVFGQAGIFSGGSFFAANAMRERAGFAFLAKHSDKFTLGFGLVYARQFYGNQLIPAIMVQYHFDDEHWRLSWLLPGSPKLSYKLNEISAIGFELKGAFGSYRLTNGRDSANYIKTTGFSGIVDYEYRFAKRWKVVLGAGLVLRQKYELYTNNDADGWYFIGSAFGHKPQPVETVEHRGAQLNIGLAFNPRI